MQRRDLDRFLFEEDDVVVALGQDGLVANLAKYLAGQPVVGLNPEPHVNPGVLVPHTPSRAAALLRAVGSGAFDVEERAMVAATLDDGIPARRLRGVWKRPRSVAWMRRPAARLADPAASRPLPLAWPWIPFRNLGFLVVVLLHGFRRLLPPYA